MIDSDYLKVATLSCSQYIGTHKIPFRFDEKRMIRFCRKVRNEALRKAAAKVLDDYPLAAERILLMQRKEKP